MLEVIRNDNGDMIAVCEWLLLNNQGQLDDTADTMFIGEMEINKQYRGQGILKQVIRNLLIKCPQASKCLFFRKGKYPDRNYSLYTRDKWIKLVGGI